MIKSEQIEKFTASQRLSIILGIGVIAIIITILLTPSEMKVKPLVASKTTTAIVKNRSKVVIPVGHQDNESGQLMRDPFAVPSNVTEHLKSQNSNISPTNPRNEPVASAEMATPKPKEQVKLTGIVNTDNQRFAVIQLANKSKAYQLDEFIGTYQLILIQEDSILLKDNNSQLFLSLESAGQKGGTK